MGFSGKITKKTDNSPRTTVVAAGTTLIGDVKLSDNFHLDGVMEGKLNSEGDVTIGSSGRYTGDVSAKRVLVSGILDGKVDADRLEIVASGQVSGEIKVRELVIESGGQFIGASQVKKHDTPQLRSVEESSAVATDAKPSNDWENKTA
ncbi:polymer-forming cytoskeletal protein [Zhongshania sp.]|uniref:bactofilin family protein n=1 Tax=Zhongshania sp. TaxID=1971902 RepID=UPI00356A3D93